MLLSWIKDSNLGENKVTYEGAVFPCNEMDTSHNISRQMVMGMEANKQTYRGLTDTVSKAMFDFSIPVQTVRLYHAALLHRTQQATNSHKMYLHMEIQTSCLAQYGKHTIQRIFC